VQLQLHVDCDDVQLFHQKKMLVQTESLAARMMSGHIDDQGAQTRCS